jgi:hypothetical protein
MSHQYIFRTDVEYFKGSNLTSGVYLCPMTAHQINNWQTESFVEIEKLILLNKDKLIIRLWEKWGKNCNLFQIHLKRFDILFHEPYLYERSLWI